MGGATAVPQPGKAFGPLAAIREQFPGWNVYRSTAGRWWATRNRHRRRPADGPAGWAMTVDGDTAADLREALAIQEAGTPG